MNADPAPYLDSSAIVKLVVDEAESRSLRAWLRGRKRRLTCGLARVEVVRAVRPQGPAAVRRARAVLSRFEIIDLDDPILKRASELDPAILRSLDAIHLAAAETLKHQLLALVTYDQRMVDGATLLGFAVEQPS